MTEFERQQPALIGGLLVGILSVLPVVQAANACCCLWALVGGAYAIKLSINRSPQRVSLGEAARITAVAGLLGAVIKLFIGMPIELATLPAQLKGLEEWAGVISNTEQKERLLEMVNNLRAMRTGQVLLNFLLPINLLGALILFGFTVVGGLLGVVLFERRNGQNNPASSNPFDSN
jgi:hypothetical protein